MKEEIRKEKENGKKEDRKVERIRIRKRKMKSNTDKTREMAEEEERK